MKLNDEQVKEILNIKDENITKSLFIELFGRTESHIEPRYNPNDWFMLKAGDIENFKDKVPIKTTVGRFLFNIFLNTSIFGKTFPYFNGTNYTKFDDIVVDAILEDKITIDQMNTYQTKKNWLGFTPVEILVPGMSMETMMPNPIIQKRKKELFKQYEKEIAAGDPLVAKKIEDELLALAREIHKGDPSMRLYDCKKPSFGNNYKNMAIMVGPIKSNTDGSYHIAENSYLEGIPQEEYGKFADQLVTGSYSRSVQTQVGGALVKEFQAALQSETVDTDSNSDCGTKLAQTITLTPSNIKMYANGYKYIVGNNGKLIRLTKSNAEQFVGKTVKVRSALFCKNPEYCEKCSGALLAKLGIKNAGLTCSDVGSRLMSLSLKSMHDSTVKVFDLEWDKYFKDFDK
ncbi:MAG: hypothetical protein J5614_03285 [Paludibacteraceae bacterium]|nr:hypothetical protein [Paludibacteraceae bacterium]